MALFLGFFFGFLFFNISKAFDSIYYKVLIKKMNDQFGIIGIELKGFESYLTYREHVCLVNGYTSSPEKILCGVLQDSILGPLLFLLYINDMPDYLKTTVP